MKRIVFLFIIVSCIAIPIAAVDAGINFSNTTEPNGTNKVFNISQANAIETFVEFPIGDISSLYISTEGRFSGIFRIKPKSQTQLLPLTQSFRFKRTDWSGNTAFNTISLQWAVGRTSFNEYSKKILNGLFDGAKVGLTVKNADIAFSLGYTGLTYKTDAKIKIDQDDRDRMDDVHKVFAPQRLFLLLSSSFQEIIPSHTFGFDALAQFDLLKQTGRTHTQYFIPYIHGRIRKNVSWKYWAAIQFGQDARFFYSLASGLSMQYTNPNWYYFTIAGKLDWAAGDYDGAKPMRPFMPIMDIKQTVVADSTIGQFSDTLTAGLTASVRPLQELLTGLSYTMLTSPNTRKAPVYVGSELSGKIAYHVYNDMNIAFTGGIFIPNRKRITAYNLHWITELTFTVKL